MTLGYFSQTRLLKERKEKGLHPICELSRFFLLVACYFCSICVSLTYAFDLFTTEFTNRFKLSVGDLSTVSTVGLVFCYFLVPYGVIFEYMGPFIPFAICAVTGFIGALCLGLIFDGKIPGNTATISVFYAFLNTASGVFDVAYISTLFEVFPRNRGPVVCLAKVMTGLGSSILSCLSATLFKDNISGFIYFICALVVVVSVFGALVIVLPPYFMNYWRRRKERSAEELLELEMTRHYYEHKSIPMRRLALGYIVTISIIVFVTIEAPVLAYVKVSRGGEIAIGVIVIILALLSFCMILPFKCLGGVDEPEPCQEIRDAVRRKCLAIKAKEAKEAAEEENKSSSSADSLKERCDVDGELLADSVDKSDPSTTPAANLDAGTIADELQLQVEPCDDANKAEADASIDDEELLQESRQDPRYDGKSVKEFLGNLDLWLVLLYFFCVFPMTYMVSFNSSTISIALSGVKRSDSLSTLYTAFLGVGNAVGRMLIGIFEAYIQSQPKDKRRFVITMALPTGPVLLIIGGILLMTIPGKIILFPYIIIYVQNGANQATMALLFTCLFERFHSTLYTIGFVVTVVVVICFNRLLFGMWVDRRHGELNLLSSQDCNVKSCVLMPLIVVTCLAGAGLIVSIFIHVRYMRFVRRMNKQNAVTA